MVVLLMRVEEALEVGEHGGVFGMIAGRGVGGGEDAGAEAGMVEVLGVGEGCGAVVFGAEELGEFVGACVVVADFLVVGAVGDEEFFVGVEEGRAGEEAVVPQKKGPGGGLEDAAAFGAGCVDVEPVERLRGDDEIDRVVGQGRMLGGAVDALEIRETAKRSLGGLAHGGVGFDGEDGVAIR